MSYAIYSTMYLVIHLAFGDLQDSELDTLPGGGMGGINVKKVHPK